MDRFPSFSEEEDDTQPGEGDASGSGPAHPPAAAFDAMRGPAGLGMGIGAAEEASGPGPQMWADPGAWAEDERQRELAEMSTAQRLAARGMGKAEAVGAAAKSKAKEIDETYGVSDKAAEAQRLAALGMVKAGEFAKSTQGLAREGLERAGKGLNTAGQALATTRLGYVLLPPSTPLPLSREYSGEFGPGLWRGPPRATPKDFSSPLLADAFGMSVPTPLHVLGRNASMGGGRRRSKKRTKRRKSKRRRSKRRTTKRHRTKRRRSKRRNSKRRTTKRRTTKRRRSKRRRSTKRKRR